ncbi:MAG TPA: hypothetical protein VIF57_15480 [Polyangia bacterium]|jgi:hypothetical protein
MKAFVVLAAAAVAGLLAEGGCGGGGQLSGSGGAGILTTGSGGGGVVGGTGTGGITGMNCAAYPESTQHLTPDLLIVLDTSASMNDAADGSCAGDCGPKSKWAAAVAAIDSVVVTATPAAANWGLKLLGTAGDACDAGGIDVPIGPQTGRTIATALADRSTPPALASPGNTPARAAIAVAAAHLAGRDPAAPRIIVLITDGVPDCKPGEPDPLASDTDGVVQAITEAQSTAVETFVVGIGTAGGPADVPLARMAVAGGMPRPVAPTYVPVAGSSDLVNALNDLVARSATCVFAIPDPPNADVDRSHISVQFPVGDGTPQTIPQDPDNGWEYTDDSMRGIQLYGTACATARGGSPVEIIFRCTGV